MSKEFYSTQDLDALKSCEYLRAYCDAELGQAKREGGKARYECAFCGHSRPKMELREKDGHGCAVCVASGTHGDVFAVAQALHAGFSFAQAVEHVAQVVGYSLKPQCSGRKGARYQGSTVMVKARHAPAIVSPAHMPVEFLDEARQAQAREAVKRAIQRPEVLARHASLLSLPVEALSSHVMKESAPHGMIGLDEHMRLVYVYLMRDAQGAYKATGFKVRSRPEDIAKGAQRFYMYGKKASLWGAAALDVDVAAYGDEPRARVRTVIITEGESDCLAVRFSLLSEWGELEHLCRNAPDDYPHPEHIPLVLARPDAGTFKPQWAVPLRGRDVILTVDNDETGEKKAQDVAQILQHAGVGKMSLWFPPDGKKDARAVFNRHAPHELINNILNNRKEYK